MKIHLEFDERILVLIAVVLGALLFFSFSIAHAEDYAKYNQYQNREDLEKRIMDTFPR